MNTPRAASASHHDVIVLGGGLAGLCLAIQLKRRDPSIDVVVLERNSHPVAEAAFKVGESTVEIGAHYFSDVLGLRRHLDEHQIRKFGFRFFFSDGRQDIDRCTEVGVGRLLPTPSWQLDRGRFENFLAEHARALGVDLRNGAVVRSLHVNGDDAGDDAHDDAGHRVDYRNGDAMHTLHARWLVDASGRAGLLKRKLDLAEGNDHDANAAWWRVDGHIDPNDWSQDRDWQRRCDPPDRWRSTNHLCGPGYWLWLIPLASGTHSIGIVCDAASHPIDTINSHDKAMIWLDKHQPRVAATLQSGKHPLRDFAFLRGFSYGCKQVFSANRWAMTGEAGLFLDPFYSPGSDFIAIANGYVCDLIEQDRRGESFAAHAAIYQQLYFSFYRNTLNLFQDQYALFGDAQVMPLKVLWDYTFYWSLLAPLFYAGRMADLAMLTRLREAFQEASTLNQAMQPLLREWGTRNADAGRSVDDGRSLDQQRIDWFHELNRALGDQLDDDTFATHLHGNVRQMRQLAGELLDQARRQHPGIGDHGLASLVGDDDRPASPLLAPYWYAASGEAAA